MSRGNDGQSFCLRCGERLQKHAATGQYVFVLVHRPDGDVRMHPECALREKNERGPDAPTSGLKDSR